MDINDLKSFKLVYETGSISKAAKQLFITPQGLSKMIQHLERNIGVTLFDRTNQGIKPTEKADYLYEKLGDILPKFEDFEQSIKHLGENGKKIKLGVASGVWNILPIEKIRRIFDMPIEIAEYPVAEVKQYVSDGTLDYGLVIGECDMPEVDTEFVEKCDIRLFAYEGHPLYGYDKVSLNMIQDVPIAILSDKFHLYREFCGACEFRGITPNILICTADPIFLHNLCCSKVCASILPSFMAEFDANWIKAIPFEEDLQWEVYAIHKAHNDKHGELDKLTKLLTEI